MRELMLGNKAVARGMYEAGCKVISSYPGTPSTEITEEAAKYDEIYCEWAPNEKVALEAAHGATLGGVRAACAMKHVGLNVAADPLFTISYQGLNAGLVICVADDPGMHSSQNEQDSRHYAFAAKVPMLEPYLPKVLSKNQDFSLRKHMRYQRNTIHRYLSKCVQELHIHRVLYVLRKE